jgi:Holliday junction resolvase RusA-like endonuclease
LLHHFTVDGTPKSLQAKSKSKKQWQDVVTRAAREAVQEDERVIQSEIAVVLVHFSFDQEERADVDNIAKPILDAMAGPVYSDDRQVTQVLVRRTSVGSRRSAIIDDPPPLLAAAFQRALESARDFVYVRVDRAPNHSRLP